MATIPNTTDYIEDSIEKIHEEEKTPPVISNMNGLQTEYAHANRWIGYIPLANVLGKRYSNLELNLVRFTIPQMEMGSSSTSFKGYEYYLPTKVMDPSTKEITFEYIIDDKWLNYRSLYTWMSGLDGNINKVDNESVIQNLSGRETLDVRVWLIDSFKNRLLDLCFYDAWIHTFQDLQLESMNTDEVHHSFTMYYSRYEIKNAVM